MKSGSPISRNSVRNTSVTTLSTDPTSEPVMPSRAEAAFGISWAASLATLSALSATSVPSFSCLTSGSSFRSSIYAGTSSTSCLVSSQIGVATQSTSTDAIRNRAAKTSSDAAPRPMPRCVRRTTSGSSPKANTTARPIVRSTSWATITA
jgi:hypothetical protein